MTGNPFDDMTEDLDTASAALRAQIAAESGMSEAELALDLSEKLATLRDHLDPELVGRFIPQLVSHVNGQSRSI